MPKTLIIQGCKDCPYLIHEKIHLMNEFKTTALLCSKYGIDLQDCDLDTPHPDCKLPDLPTQTEIHKGIEDSCNTLQGNKETRESRTSLNEAKKWNGIGFVEGVKWTIEQISNEPR